MATNFFRVNVDDYSFIRGAARIMYAPITQLFPDEIGDVISLGTTVGSDAVQSIVATGATSGAFEIELTDQFGETATSASIAFNDTAAEVETALQGMSNIGTGNVVCTGGPLPTTPVVCTFGSALANLFVPEFEITASTLAGGSAAVTVTEPGASSLSLYDACDGWSDLGATKTGIQVTINNTEDQFTIDQQLGPIGSAPSGWTCGVSTAVAEITPERLQTIWEGSEITINSSPTIPEKNIGFGAPNSYIQRRIAVLFQRPSGLIRGFFFRIAQRSPQESSLNFASTGDQQSVPASFNILADNTITDPYQQFFMIYDQAIS